MSDIGPEATAVAFWIRDNDRMLISHGAMSEIDKAVQAARAAGVAAERARIRNLIEAEIGRLKEKVEKSPGPLLSLNIPAQIGRLIDILNMVRS